MPTKDEPDPLRFLYYSGFWYRNQPSSCYCWQILRFMRSILMSIVCIALLSVTLHFTITNCKFNTVNASYPITCCWQLQQVLNILILHYWQFTNSAHRHLRPILCLPSAQRIQQHTQRLCLLLVLIIFLFLCSVLVASRFDDGKSEMFSYKKIFNQVWWLYVPARIVGWYMIMIFLLVNYYFHGATGVVLHELRQFNRRFKSEFQLPIDVEEMDSKLGCDMARKMYDYYKEHLLISNQIRSLDKVFNVYTLVNAATSIPCTVFTLWTLFLRIGAASWMHVLLTFVELFLCIVSLLALLTNPSRIKVQLRHTRALLFSSPALWQLYVPKVCDIGRLFVAHLDQDELGISLWGLITISKSLTLSVVSVTVTFLVFLLELNGNRGESKDFGGVISRLLD